MASGDDELPAYEVVFAIEATSNMVNHWDSIKKLYITPIIQQFHKLSSSGNELLTSSFKNSYGLVLFYAADKTPDMLAECFPPLGNRWQFSKLLDTIELNGGGAEHHSYIAEGLATVSQLFDDMKYQQKNKNVERFCILISNTPPYELPAVESFVYSGLTYQNLTEKLKERGVKLSIICPHLIKELKQLFLLANNNPTPLMNYAQDKRHLVLISGFHLSLEKEPWQLTDNPVNDPIKPVKTEVTAPVPMEVTSSNEDVLMPSIGNNVTVKSEFQPMSQPPPTQPTPVNSYSPAPNPIPPVPAPVSQPQVAPNQIFSEVSLPNLPIKAEPMSVTANQPMVSQTTNVVRPTVPSFPSTSNQIPDQKPAQFNNALKEAEKIRQIASNQIPPPLEPNQRPVWSGMLEWSEKRRLPNPGGKITQTVTCQISQVVANPRDAINASNWSPKLTVQLIPQHVISQSTALHSYLKVNKPVFLHFPPQHIAQMVNLFSQRNVHGLIQHLSQNEDKLMFFFLKKKDDRTTFVGILPDDPQGFMTTLRSVIQSKYQTKRPNIPMPQPGGDANAAQRTMVQPVSQQGVAPGAIPFRGPQTRMQFPGQAMTNQEFPGNSNQPQQAQGLSQPVNQGMNNIPQQPQGLSLTVNQGMNNISTINAPISQPIMNMRPQAGQPIMRPQLSDNMNVMNNIRSGMSTTENTGQQQIRPNLGSIGGQRVIQGGINIANNPRAGMMRVQQMSNMSGNMSGNRPMRQPTNELRNLLGPGNNVMQSNNMNMHQQDNSGMRPNASNNMQQQNFMRGSNMMSGMQNQRNFGGLN